MFLCDTDNTDRREWIQRQKNQAVLNICNMVWIEDNVFLSCTTRILAKIGSNVAFSPLYK